MNRLRPIHAKALPAALAAAMLCALPASAETVKKVAADRAAAVKTAEPRTRLSTARSVNSAPLKAETLGSFTPPMLDNVRRAPGSASASVQERTFRFTPSGKAKDNKALALGVTSRVVRAVAPETARSPETEVSSAYNVDVSLAFHGFALSGGFSRLDSVLRPGREGVDLGLSYRGNRWKTALQVNADRAAGGWATPLNLDKRYTVELGGAYALSPRLSVMGGVRYQMTEPDASGRYMLRSADNVANAGEAGAVYLGTSISF